MELCTISLLCECCQFGDVLNWCGFYGFVASMTTRRPTGVSFLFGEGFRKASKSPRNWFAWLESTTLLDLYASFPCDFTRFSSSIHSSTNSHAINSSTLITHTLSIAFNMEIAEMLLVRIVNAKVAFSNTLQFFKACLEWFSPNKDSLLLTVDWKTS